MDDAELQRVCDLSAVHRQLGLVMRNAPNGVEIEASPDEATALEGPEQTVHGGVVATLLDTAATFALIAQSGHDWTTVDLRIDYLRPTPLGPVSVRGEVVRQGKRIGRARSALTDPAGKVCAIAIGTFVPVGGS